MITPGRRLYVVADVHGYPAALAQVLADAGITDGDGRWKADDARLWFLGDYVDRGPDGIGVIDAIRTLSDDAAAVGGEVGALLGNHEVRLLAAHLFGDTPIPGCDLPGGFRRVWDQTGGQEADLCRLTPDVAAWIRSLPAAAVVDDHLLLHADTARYLEFGPDLAGVNAAVRATLSCADLGDWATLCDRISDRGAFRTVEPATGADLAWRPTAPDDAVKQMLTALGGDVVVHGHSTLSRYFGIPAGEVRQALRYAGGRVVAVDGGRYEGGRILVTRLS